MPDELEFDDDTRLAAELFASQPLAIRVIRGFWSISPFTVAGITFLLGIPPMVAACFMLPLGNITYLRATAAGGEIEKQVGYAFAVNWWPVLIVLMPMALFFAFSSVQNMQALFLRMLRARMFCDMRWSFSRAPDSPTVTGLRRMVRQTWTTFGVAGFMIFLIVAPVIVHDWYCVVQQPLLRGDLLHTGNPTPLPALCQNISGQEVDWSIAAIFHQAPSITALPGTPRQDLAVNMVFSGYVYLLILLELSVLMVFYAYVFALAATIWRLQRGGFGIRLLPNLNSGDPLRRMGFETFEQVFRPCILATITAFCMAFLMRIQNAYLRSDDHTDIFGFMFEDIVTAVRSLFEISLTSLFAVLDGLRDTGEKLGRVLDLSELSDPGSLIGGPAVIMVFALVAVALGFVLREAAKDAVAQVLLALRSPETEARIVAHYGQDRGKLEAALQNIEVWPLSWPRLRQSILLLVVGIACFFLYRLALIWIGVVVVRAVRGDLAAERAPR